MAPGARRQRPGAPPPPPPQLCPPCPLGPEGLPDEFGAGVVGAAAADPDWAQRPAGVNAPCDQVRQLCSTAVQVADCAVMSIGVHSAPPFVWHHPARSAVVAHVAFLARVPATFCMALLHRLAAVASSQEPPRNSMQVMPAKGLL
mmetsp:Transcript_36736/g.114351  ORF Transcript_36736/g.114351 Transcript_36736/m.114351 type:complete len:145 (-) Transcript_36736:251-685(-)